MAGQFGASGTDENVTGRTTKYSAQAAEKTNQDGEILEMQSHGAKIETTEDGFLEGTFANEAVNGQNTLAAGDGIVTDHELVEQNDGFARVKKTTVKPGPAAA